MCRSKACVVVCLQVVFFYSQLVSSAYIFGWMLHNPIPDESVAESTQNDFLVADNDNATARLTCHQDSDCADELYCDTHYGFCETKKSKGELCRRDEGCSGGLICIFGKCDVPSKPGHKGARCNKDRDCNPNFCCARQHGEKICKNKLHRGHRCFVPLGGLDYSLNELCPCDEGLTCAKQKAKSKR